MTPTYPPCSASACLVTLWYDRFLPPPRPDKPVPLPPRPVSVMEQRSHPVLSQCLKTFVGHSKAVTAITMAPDGEHFVTASADHTINVWHKISGEVVNTLT